MKPKLWPVIGTQNCPVSIFYPKRPSLSRVVVKSFAIEPLQHRRGWGGGEGREGGGRAGEGGRGRGERGGERGGNRLMHNTYGETCSLISKKKGDFVRGKKMCREF